MSLQYVLSYFYIIIILLLAFYVFFFQTYQGYCNTLIYNSSFSIDKQLLLAIASNFTNKSILAIVDQYTWSLVFPRSS